MTRLENLEKVVEEALSSSVRDRSSVYVSVFSDSQAVSLLCTDAETLDALLPKLQEHVEGLPVQGIQLPNASLQGLTAWVTTSVADVRSEPRHAAEQVTQALQGEAITPLYRQDGWLLGRSLDGYIGWIRDWHLQLVQQSVAEAFRVRADARIQAVTCVVREAPHEGAAVCGETMLGTRVLVRQTTNAWVEIELPGGRHGWVPEPNVRRGTEDWPSGSQAILETLKRFMGVPYIWGGRSPKGFDCSGLVQFVFGLHGIDLPRDSQQQGDCGQVVEEVQPGDLLFFGRDSIGHVAVVVSGSTYIHARGEVRVNSLTPKSPIYDPELAGMFRGARRLLTQPT